MVRVTTADDPVKAQEDFGGLGRLGLDLGNATWAAVNGRSTAYTGHTIGSFIAALRQLGLQDNDELGSIEFGNARFGTRYIHVERDELGAVEIREVA